MSKQVTVYTIMDCLEERKKGVETVEERHRLRDLHTMISEEFGGWDQDLSTKKVASIIEQAFILGQNTPKKDENNS